MSGSIKVGGHTVFVHTGASGAGTLSVQGQNGNTLLTDDGTAVSLGNNVRLPASGGIKDSSGNNILTESGGNVSFGNIRLPASGGIKDSSGNNILTESGGVVSIDGTFNGTIGTTASLPAGAVVQTEYQFVNFNGVPTAGGTNVGSSVTVLYPCTKILCQIVVTVSSPLVYANYGTYSINIQTDATISVSNTSTVGPNNSFVGADLAQDGENVYGTLTSSKLFIRNSGSPSYYNTGDTFQPSITVGPVYGGSYFYEMGIHIYFIK